MSQPSTSKSSNVSIYHRRRRRRRHGRKPIFLFLFQDDLAYHLNSVNTTLLKVKDLKEDEVYTILDSAPRTSKFGDTLLLTVRDGKKKRFKMFLPNRYYEKIKSRKMTKRLYFKVRDSNLVFYNELPPPPPPVSRSRTPSPDLLAEGQSIYDI